MIDKLGGRKALVTLLVVAVGTAIELCSQKGLSVNMLQLLSIVFGAFVVGNGIEHCASAASAGKVAPTEDSRLNGVLAQMDATSKGTQARLSELAQNAQATTAGISYVVDYIKQNESPRA